jgi:hypothetical protein
MKVDMTKVKLILIHLLMSDNPYCDFTQSRISKVVRREKIIVARVAQDFHLTIDQMLEIRQENERLKILLSNVMEQPSSPLANIPAKITVNSLPSKDEWEAVDMKSLARMEELGLLGSK